MISDYVSPLMSWPIQVRIRGVFVQGIRENINGYMIPRTGTWLEEKLENIKKEVHTLTKRTNEKTAPFIYLKTFSISLV